MSMHRYVSPQAWCTSGLVLLGLATGAPAAEEVPGIGAQRMPWLDRPFRPDDPMDLTMHFDFRHIPDRDHLERSASYDQQVWEGQADGTILVTEFEQIPVRIGGRFDFHYRDHRVRTTGDVVPLWVESGTVNTLTGGNNTGTNTATTNGEDLAAYSLLSDNTLPTSRMHNTTLSLNSQVDFDGPMGFQAEGRLIYSRSRNGMLDGDWGFSAAMTWNFNRNERLLVGATMDTLSGRRYTEDTILPLIEWHAQISDDLNLVLGFPKMGVRWKPLKRMAFEARWNFPYDAEVAFDVELPYRFGLHAKGWMRSQAFTAGTNQLLREVRTDFYFFHPLGETNAYVGEDVHLYIQESGVSLEGSWRHEDLGLVFHAGPVFVFDEIWREGVKRTEIQVTARLRSKLGLAAGLSATF